MTFTVIILQNDVMEVSASPLITFYNGAAKNGYSLITSV